VGISKIFRKPEKSGSRAGKTAILVATPIDLIAD